MSTTAMRKKENNNQVPEEGFSVRAPHCGILKSEVAPFHLKNLMITNHVRCDGQDSRIIGLSYS